MKIFYCLLLLISGSFLSEAQQVKKIDCCYDVSPKATIIINDNSGNGTTSSSATVSNAPGNGVFNFELKSTLNTSAGVYNSSGVLVRTLWSGVRYDAGCYSAQWDGYLDDGTTVALVGDYTVQVLSNDVQYKWLGTIGTNAANPLDGPFAIGNGIADIVATNDTVYTAQGYAERDISHRRFSTANPVTLSEVLPGPHSIFTTSTCKNDNFIFFGGRDEYGTTNNMVFAINRSTGKEAIFLSGQSYNTALTGRNYKSVIAFSDGRKGLITEIDANNSNLFVAYNTGLIELYDLKNKSGGLISSTNLGTLSGMCFGNGKLWIISNGLPKRYSVSDTGIITDDNFSISGVNADRIKYNQFADEIAVADINTQTYRFYNNQTGAYKSTLGQSGGYVTNGPAITNNKFCFLGSRAFIDGFQVTHTSLAFQPDGKIWIADNGNYRLQQFNADKVFLQTVMYAVSSRQCTVDSSDPTRILSDAIEYKVDLSKLDGDIAHSFTLAYNWGVSIKDKLSAYGQITNMVDLPNGKTYAQGQNNLIELNKNTGGVYLKDLYGYIEADGSLWSRGGNDNHATNVYKQTLSFDQNNIPVWGTNVVMAGNVVMDDPESPVYYANNTTGQSTNSEKIFFYNPNYDYTFYPNPTPLGQLYHLGGKKIGSPDWDFRTSKGTKFFLGPYPTDGYFATNGGHSENCLLNVYGNHLFTHVNDELGFYTEVCRTNHFYSNGLFIGTFGTDISAMNATGDQRYFAGNSFKTCVFPANGNLYQIWCDERAKGVHVSRVSNLASVNIQSVSLKVSSAIKSVTTDQSDLMYGIPFKSSGFYSGNGWTMNPASGADASVQYPGWRVRTTINAYKKEDDDIFIESDGNSGSSYKTISRALGSNSTKNWTLSGQFKLNSNLNDNYSLDILDISGKDLIHIRTQYNRILLHGNFYQEQIFDANILSVAFVPFVVKNVNGLVSVSVGGLPFVNVNSYESGGNFSTPTTFQVRAGGAGDNNHTLLSVKGLRFTQ